MTQVSLRYFAGVADAAGCREESIEVPEGATVAEMCRSLSAVHGPEFARIVAVSALLIDGARANETAPVPVRDGLVVDVLPPFAGG